MTNTILTPFDLSSTVKVAKRTFRKQILPVGSINYKGRRIEFTKAYLSSLAESFHGGAYDQVPVNLATDENKHNENPRNFAGEMTDVELTDDGLYGIISTTKEGADILGKNPRLGVSARLVAGLEKADGRKFANAIRHVLLTMDPRVTGMKPWEAVDLSQGDEDLDQVVDFTAETYQEGTMPVKTAKKVAAPKAKTPVTKGKTPATKAKAKVTAETGPLDLSDLSEDDLDTLLSEEDSTEVHEETPAVDDTEVTPDEVDVEGEEDEDDEDEDGDSEVEVEETATRVVKGKSKNLSAKRSKKAVDLTEDDADDVIAGEQRDELAQMRIDLAEERWRRDRADLVRSGVPPFLLDLAEPVLSSPDEVTLDLSNSDEPVDARGVISDLLAGVRGMIDLHPEAGHTTDLSEDDSPAKAAADFNKQWDEEYGAV